ncbi:flagellar filament capping protein FliD [Cohnella laeviribosi]|uniref:flagellar filament capping protein FliD n=1 Tax=Cohnella laeviribosi TaxID=380174 RepID=UPI00036C5F23|nr:flagellar filament capping protein FliD [Cohnella laeviribosi]
MAVSSVNTSSVSLTGLFSKLDTDTLISALMASDKTNYTTLENRKNDYGKIQSLFRTLNTKVSALRTAASDLLYMSNLTKTAATSSDTKVLNVSSSAGAAKGTYQVVVNNIAQNHIIRTDSVNSSGTSVKAGIASDATITIDDVTINVGQLAADAATDKDFLTSLKNAINAGSANLTASLLQTSDTEVSLVLSSKNTGAGNSIKVGSGAYGITGDSIALQKLGLVDAGNNLKNVVQEAADANFTVNGVTVTSSSNTVAGVIENVSFSLVAPGTTTVSVDTDTEAVAGLISAFVDAYNAVIDAVNSAKSFTDSNYRTPLSADSTLNSLLSSLGNWVNLQAGTKADGKSDLSLKYLFQIGLEVDKGATSASEMTGKMSFDKNKFIEALKKDPDAVYKLLANDEADTSKGIARVFSDNLFNWSSASNGILKTKIEGYDSEISFITDQMEQMQIRLDVKEAALKQKFAQMETALSTLQSQQSWMNGVVSAMYSKNS